MLKYEVHEADASKGYNFPFILVYPEQLPEQVKIFVEGNNSTEYEKIDKDKKVVGHQTFEEQKQDAIKFADFIVGPVVEDKYNHTMLYHKLNQPLVIPIIERCDAEHEGEYYTQMLGRNVMLDKTSKFANLTQQVVAMVNEAKKICLSKKQDIKIEEKAGLCGFSASGVFASRMLFAEPETFDACLSICSNAVQPLPVDEMYRVKLPYPLGTADYEKIFGKPFNEEEYRKAKQLFIVGEDEAEKSYNIVKKARLHDEKVRDRYIQLYGDVSIQERQNIISEIMQDLGMNRTMSLVVPGDHTMEGKGRYISQFVNAVSVPTDAQKSVSQTSTTTNQNNTVG